MSLQVDLLKKVERRYQGIVSMKVMAIGSVSVLVGVTILVFLLAGISKMTLSANLDRARNEFGRLDPQAAMIRNGQAAIDANRKTLEDLKNWSQGEHIPMFSILRSVQREIPAQMALENLYAGLESEAEAGPVYFILRLSGRAQGELTAVDAKRRLNSSAELRRFCGETKLVSSQREAGEKWMFMLEGRRLAGDVKR
jgi:hypothetical protein